MISNIVVHKKYKYAKFTFQVNCYNFPLVYTLFKKDFHSIATFFIFVFLSLLDNKYLFRLNI